MLDSSKQASLPYCLRTSDEIDLAVAHCVRDSRAVAYSWAQQVARPEGTSDANREMHRLAPASTSFYWLLHNAEVDLYRAMNGGTLQVRYEDWVREPYTALAAILTFAGVSPDSTTTIPAFEDSNGNRDFVLGTSHTCSGNPMRFTQGTVQLRSDDRWRAGMQQRDRRLVTALTWPLLRRYGYLSSSTDLPEQQPDLHR